MTPEAFWGAAFLLWIVGGLWVSSETAGRPPSVSEESLQMQAWKAAHNRHTRLLYAWGIGFAALIGAYLLAGPGL